MNVRIPAIANIAKTMLHTRRWTNTVSGISVEYTSLLYQYGKASGDEAEEVVKAFENGSLVFEHKKNTEGDHSIDVDLAWFEGLRRR